MKKGIVVFILLLLVPAQALALQSSVTARINMVMNEAKCLTDLTVTVDTDGEITKDKGLNLVLGVADRILWDRRSVVDVQGSAVDNKKISSSVVPVYSADYKSVKIPVLANLSAGETFTLSNGLCLRAYDRSVGVRPIGLDVNGDLVPDFFVENSFSVDGLNSKTDVTIPYPPTEFKYTYDPVAKKVQLTWINPPDYDLLGVYLIKTLVRGGVTTTKTLLNQAWETQYSDPDVQSGDRLSYRLYGVDRRNEGESANLSVDLTSTPVPTPTPAPTPAPTPTPQPSTELAQLDQLYGYYKIRQSIKCREGVSATDSNCLWAKIDVAYAQKLLERSDVNIVLSAHDLYLMGLRIVWPEKRYQTECVEATVPAKSCPALEKSIKRVHYFID